MEFGGSKKKKSTKKRKPHTHTHICCRTNGQTDTCTLRNFYFIFRGVRIRESTTNTNTCNTQKENKTQSIQMRARAELRICDGKGKTHINVNKYDSMVCAIMKANRKANKGWCVFIENEHRAYAVHVHIFILFPHDTVILVSDFFLGFFSFLFFFFDVDSLFLLVLLFRATNARFPSFQNATKYSRNYFHLFRSNAIHAKWTRANLHVRRTIDSTSNDVFVHEYSEVMRERVYRVYRAACVLWPKNRAEKKVSILLEIAHLISFQYGRMSINALNFSPYSDEIMLDVSNVSLIKL